ncbi:hypothetical protein MKW94_017843, partial [Papaver nudicaule]|nr:hypothetical protein [Papaver nudicaule]
LIWVKDDLRSLSSINWSLYKTTSKFLSRWFKALSCICLLMAHDIILGKDFRLFCK